MQPTGHTLLHQPAGVLMFAFSLQKFYLGDWAYDITGYMWKRRGPLRFSHEDLQSSNQEKASEVAILAGGPCWKLKWQGHGSAIRWESLKTVLPRNVHQSSPEILH
jgi:hypothetical protein